jgi:hypothetical protein
VGLALSIIIYVIAIRIFKKLEGVFADVVWSKQFCHQR